MRYYVYVSDTKLDMPAAQVPPKLREKVAAEFKVDLKILSLSLKENSSEANRYAKVELVRQFLAKENAIGDIESNEGWFEGAMPMHWGPFQHHEPGTAEYDSDFPMVFFAGETETLQLGLGGSLRHLLGEQSSLSADALTSSRVAPIFTSFSEGYAILHAVRQAITDVDERQLSGGPHAVAVAVDRALGTGRIFDLPPTPVEFLARRLADIVLDRRSGPTRVILGTPLYVARAD